jgi:hypothetical protein
VSRATPKAVMPIITVGSVDEVRNFYVEKLGFDHLMGVVGKDSEFDFVTVIKEGARIMFAACWDRWLIARSSRSRSTSRSVTSKPTAGSCRKRG